MHVQKNGNPIQFNSMTLSDDDNTSRGKKGKKKRRKNELQQTFEASLCKQSINPIEKFPSPYVIHFHYKIKSE
jgi:hypothetical protein